MNWHIFPGERKPTWPTLEKLEESLLLIYEINENDCVMILQKDSTWLHTAYLIFDSLIVSFCIPTLYKPPSWPHNPHIFSHIEGIYRIFLEFLCILIAAHVTALLSPDRMYVQIRWDETQSVLKGQLHSWRFPLNEPQIIAVWNRCRAAFERQWL